MRRSMYSRIIVLLASLGPGVASATSQFPQGQIFFQPESVSAIPTLSDGMLIGLAVLLVVMGLRFAREHGNVFKSVAGTLLLSGLVMGGYGIEQSLATSEHTIASQECQVGGNHEFQADRPNAITNSCANPMRITALQCAAPDYSGSFNKDCTVGTVLSGGGDVCDTPRCGEF